MLAARCWRAALDDLVVVAHGWNNDMADARALYRDLLANVRRALDRGRAPGLAGRRIAVLGVLWPSKKFADEDLIPGGGASLGGARRRRDAAPSRSTGSKGTFDAPDDGSARAGQDARAAARDAIPRRGRSSSIAALGAARARGPGRRRLRPVLRIVRRGDLRPARGAVLPGPPAGGGGGGHRGDRPCRGRGPWCHGRGRRLGDFFGGIKAAAGGSSTSPPTTR